MSLTVYTIEQEQEWDDVVRSFQYYDVYYLSRYVKAFQIHGDGEPLLFYYDDGIIRAINVVMKRDIADDPKFEGKILLGTNFDIVTPYGYGGFLMEGEKTQNSFANLFHEYDTYCKDNGIISEFIRFHPVLGNNEGLEHEYDILKLGKTVSVKLKSSDYIWNNLTSKNRNVIRKAKKSGVEIYWGRSPRLIDRFIDMYNITMDRDKAEKYYYFEQDFYNSILNDLKYNFLMFYAIYKGKIVAMSMILFSNNQMHYHLSASDVEYRHLAPSNLLLYEAGCWGCENGFKIFHLGGGLGSKEDNLYKFKKAFNKETDNDFFVGKRIFNQEIYNELIEIRKIGDFSSVGSYFPIYRV